MFIVEWCHDTSLTLLAGVSYLYLDITLFYMFLLEHSFGHFISQKVFPTILVKGKA